MTNHEVLGGELGEVVIEDPEAHGDLGLEGPDLREIILIADIFVPMLLDAHVRLSTRYGGMFNEPLEALEGCRILGDKRLLEGL